VGNEELSRILLVTDGVQAVGLQRIAQFLPVPTGVPTPDDFAAADLVLILGPLRDQARTLELAGALKLARERGASVVFAYKARFDLVDPLLFRDLEPLLRGVPTGDSLKAVADHPAPHPAFREYLTLHGQTSLRFASLPDDAEVLARVQVTLIPYETAPTAVYIEYARGSLYVLPYQSAGEMWSLLDRLVQSIWDHREGRLLALPVFFDELHLPGEDQMSQAIEKHRRDLGRLEEARAALTQHKLLVGHGSGDALESLVVEELSFVLAGSGLQARDVEERGVEDFEVVDERGERRAFAESKASGRSVTLEHVNQLNSHRTELFDATSDELAGLLVVNTFRNDDALDRRRGAIDERVIRHAKRMNVLILRTWDLYELVARQLAGEDESRAVAAAIQGGGGWLEATEKELTHHGAAS